MPRLPSSQNSVFVTINDFFDFSKSDIVLYLVALIITYIDLRFTYYARVNNFIVSLLLTYCHWVRS